jgi:hypothetical protein
MAANAAKKAENRAYIHHITIILLDIINKENPEVENYKISTLSSW